MKEVQENSFEMEENTLATILRKQLKHWPFFLMGILIAFAIVFMYLRYVAVPQYEVRGTILIKNTTGGQGIGDIDNFKDLGLIKNSQSLEDEIGILTSAGTMEEVVSSNSFNISYYVDGSIKDVEIYGEDVPIKVIIDETAENIAYGLPITIRIINGQTYELSVMVEEEEQLTKHNFGDLVTVPYGTFTIVPKLGVSYTTMSKPLFFKINNKDAVINSFLGSLNVVPANKTGTSLSLSFITNIQKKGEDVLSKLIETYISKTIKYENELAENTIKMIDERLEILTGEIEEVESTVVDIKTSNVMTDVSNNGEIFIEQSNEYKKRVTDYQTQLNVLDQIENNLENSNMESTISASSALNDPNLTGLINTYNETYLKKENLSQSAVASNPVLVNLNSNLESLRNSILQNINSSKTSLSIAKGNLQSNANRYDAQIARVPGVQKQLSDISRDQGTKEGLYLYLLQKREEEILSLAVPVSSTRIVSLPKAGKFPISPNKKLMYLAGLLFGIFVPYSLLFAKEAMNTKIKSLDDLAVLKTVPVLGQISKSKENGIIFPDNKKDASTLELFRLLRFNLDYLKKTEKNQTLMVTSTSKGEGKTFIAANLAVSLAAVGEKVALLSFDLRQPKLMRYFGLEETPGITDFVIKKGMDMNEVFQNYALVDNLTLIGSGPVSTQISAVLLSERIGVLLNDLKKKYDRIILDTAPIGLISDAFALNEYVDTTIYVVRKNVTKKEHLKGIADIRRNGKLNNCVVLLNDADLVENYGYADYRYN